MAKRNFVPAPAGYWMHGGNGQRRRIVAWEIQKPDEEPYALAIPVVLEHESDVYFQPAVDP